MTLTFAAVLASAGIDPAEALVIRHAYVRKHEDGTVGIHGDSSDEEIMAYTRVQSANTRTFPAAPPKFWIVFLPEGVIAPGCGRLSSTTARVAATMSGARSISNSPTSWQACVAG